MELEAFAATRSEDLRESDDFLRPAVRIALGRMYSDDPDWDDFLVKMALRVWGKHFEEQAPGRKRSGAYNRARKKLLESLSKTSDMGELGDAQVNRVTTWLSTAMVNLGTLNGAYAAGMRYKKWLTMDDADVREIHRPLDGEVRHVGSPFNVGGTKLGYPGEPIGPPEVWISCRCVLIPAEKEGMAMSAMSYALKPDEVVVEDEEVVEEEPVVDDDEPTIDEIGEIPVHGILAPEGIATGDGRGFLEGALSTRQLPVPLRYEILSSHGGDTSEVVTVGRIDEAWRDDEANTWKFQGAIIADKDHADAAIRGIVDGSGTGVSIDADRAERDGRKPEGFEDSDDSIAWLSSARVAGLTIVPIPAFEGAYISLGTFEDECADCEEDAVIAAADGGDEEATEKDSSIIFGILDPEGEAFAASSEAVPHLTMVYMGTDETLGNGSALATLRAVSEAAATIDGEVTLPVTGRHELGDEGADVITVDGSALADVRESLVGNPAISAGVKAVEQFPDWTPHVTLGHPDAPATSEATPEQVTIIGLGVMRDNDPIGFYFGDSRGDSVVASGTFTGAFRDVSQDERDKLADEGKAMPDGSYPVANVEDLKNAIQAIGRAKDPKAVRRFLKKRAEELNAEGLIPEDWSTSTQAFAPGTKDGPGWVTNPGDTARLRRYWVRGKGAAKIQWGVPGDFNRCRVQLGKYIQRPDWLAGTCANMHKEAIGVWPGQEGALSARNALIASGALGTKAAPMVRFESQDEGYRVYPSEWFQDPGFSKLTPLTVDRETGRVYGHLAQWGSCHIGIGEMCISPPHSSSSYAFFLKGSIETDSGTQAVGTLTYGIGHANPRARAAAASAHYDKTSAVVAFVNVGEDQYGIWYSGVLRPGLSLQKADEFRAIGALSGDWRPIGRRGYELVAAVAVNTPGYQLPAYSVSAEGFEAIIAAGMVEPTTIESTPVDNPVDNSRSLAMRDRVRAFRAGEITEKIKKRGL